MKRILFIETGTTGGGSFESLVQLARHINTDEFECVFAFVTRTHHWDTLESLGFEVTKIKSKLLKPTPEHTWMAQALSTITKAVRRPGRFQRTIRKLNLLDATQWLSKFQQKRKFNLIHSNDNTWRNSFVMNYCRRQHIPCIDHLRSHNVHEFDKRWARECSGPTIRHVAISEFIQQTWVACGLPANHISVIPNGINCIEQMHRREIRTEEQLPHESHVVVAAGRMIGQKGFQFLLDAFAEVARSVPNTYLVLYGDGPHRNRLIEQAGKLGVSSKVRFPGYCKHYREYLSSADVFVLPSISEPFGRVLLEAMLENVPIVATNSGAVPEIITHEQTGLLVPAQNHFAIATAVTRLLLDRELANSIAKEAHKVLIEKYQIQFSMAKITKLYHQISQAG